MKNVILSSVAVVILAACGSSPKQLCTDTATTMCNKMYTCYTGTQLDGIKTVMGATEADCVTKQTVSCNRSDYETKPCDTGKTYDASAASACSSAVKALTCADFTGSTFGDKLKGNCDLVCK